MTSRFRPFTGTQRFLSCGLGIAWALTLGGCATTGIEHILDNQDKLAAWAENQGDARRHKELHRESRHRGIAKTRRARRLAVLEFEFGDRQAAFARLLRDYRRGGHVESLLLLAGLEHRAGLDGMAARHYARASILGIPSHWNLANACALWRQRAERAIAVGEGRLADADMRRMAEHCRADVRAVDPAEWQRLRRIARRLAIRQKIAQRTFPAVQEQRQAADDTSPVVAPVSLLDEALGHAGPWFASEPNHERTGANEAPPWLAEYKRLRRQVPGRVQRPPALQAIYAPPTDAPQATRWRFFLLAGQLQQALDELKKLPSSTSSTWSKAIVLQLLARENEALVLLQTKSQDLAHPHATALIEDWTMKALRRADLDRARAWADMIPANSPARFRPVLGSATRLISGAKIGEERFVSALKSSGICDNEPAARLIAQLVEFPERLANPDYGHAWVSAASSELVPGCALRWGVAVLAQGGHEPLLHALLSHLLHGPEDGSAEQWLAMAEIASALDQPGRSELFALKGAARATEPQGAWLRLAEVGLRYDDRNLELRALVESISHVPPVDHRREELLRRLMVLRLGDLLSDPFLKSSQPQAMRALQLAVAEYPQPNMHLLAAVQQRWGREFAANPAAQRQLAALLQAQPSDLQRKARTSATVSSGQLAVAVAFANPAASLEAGRRLLSRQSPGQRRNLWLEFAHGFWRLDQASGEPRSVAPNVHQLIELTRP